MSRDAVANHAAASARDEPADRGLRAIDRAVLTIAAELELEPMLRRLADAARELVGADYAAIGVPDGAGGFERFVTSGVSDATIAAIGWLPRTHGLLGSLLDDHVPVRVDDIRADDRYRGWPDAHPDMTSFLGVPILARGDVVGEFYLADKIGADAFADADVDVLRVLAAHAAIAIENARLFEASRELSVAAERERLARELHDAMAQTLFSIALTAESAAAVVADDPDRAAEHIRVVARLATDVQAELRTLVYDLRPPRLEADGLVVTVERQAALLARIHATPIHVRASGDTRLAPDVESQVFRVVQEALHNALQHAAATRVDVTIDMAAPKAVVTVVDDGVGFDPNAVSVRTRRLGLASMRERALRIGGNLRIDAEPGHGTAVRLEVPDG